MSFKSRSIVVAKRAIDMLFVFFRAINKDYYEKSIGQMSGRAERNCLWQRLLI